MSAVTVLQTAISVATPLSVVGLAIGVLYLLYVEVLKQKLAPLMAAHSFVLLNSVLRYVFYLAMTALVLGMGTYATLALCKDTNFCRTAAVDQARLEAEIQQHLAQGYYLDALQAAERLVGAFPGSAKAHRLKGNALYRMKNYQLALAAFDEALKLDPQSVEARFNKGATLLNLRDHAGSEKIFAGLLDANAADMPSRFNLAEAQLLLKKYADARGNYRIVHKSSPRHQGGSALGLGIISALAPEGPGAMTAAMRYFGEAVCVDPKLRAIFSGVAVEDGTQRFDTYLEFVGELKKKQIPAFRRFLLDLEQGKLSCSTSQAT